MNKRKFCAAILPALLCITLFINGCSFVKEDFSKTDILMGTVLSVSYTSQGTGSGEKIWSEFEKTGSFLEQDLLSRRIDDTEISKINASAGNPEGYPLSEELEHYINLCLELSKETDGAFDITLGELIKLWDIDEKALSLEGNVPAAEDINKVLSHCGYDKVTIDNHRIYIPEGMSLDMGAVGKGIYLQKAMDILDESAIHGVVSAGGSILTFREKGADSWRVGVVKPFDTTKVFGVISANGTNFISTSGDYERYFYYEGVKYHHILDSKTGYPADTGISSVTVVLDGSMIDGGLISDALSTAIFVLGEEKGILLAEKYDAEILIIRKDGSSFSTEGMQKMLDVK